jgi:hypothetical protein
MAAMARLLAFLALLTIAFAPAVARALPAMSCCPAEMAMDAGHGHGRPEKAPPGDAADCAAHAATPAELPAVDSGEALPPSPRLIAALAARPAGRMPALEPPPPRLSA